MTTIETLRSLQQRVREATGQDPELDLAIARAFEQPTFRIYSTKEEVAKLYTTDPDGLGACVALMRDAVDGTWGRDENGRFWVRSGDIETRSRWHKNACIEFLDAIVSARIAELEAEAKERVG